MGDVYRAKRDCYYNGNFLRKGETITVGAGTSVVEKFLEPVSKAEPVKSKKKDEA